jgi:chromosome segregation protein
MPKLKKLEVQGFKSFAETSTFLYPTGITAVVGPNGSGKSNVADAIQWALGEQRMTTIRGRSGEDMIFAGSSKRARSGMARAAITFDNGDEWLPVDFAEVTIERRVYRDGKSDYILNGSKVRLMDLRELLDRAGLGRDDHLIISQGAVDQVLSLRPGERLGLFEQAAGIAPYRNRREEASDRLGETRHNLERVYDIVGEIEPRLRRLRRQAERADQHTLLDEELKATLKIWYGYRWANALNLLQQARQRVSYRETRALGLMEKEEALTETIAKHRRDINQARDQLSILHRESGQWHSEAGDRQRELAVAQERQRQLYERISESEDNLVPLRSAQEEETAEIEQLNAELEALSGDLQKAMTRLDEAQSAHDAVEAQRQTLLRAQGEAQSHALENRHQIADRQSRLEQSKARLDQLSGRERELREALDSLEARSRDQQRKVREARKHRQALQSEIEVWISRTAERRDQLESVEDRVEAIRQGLREQENVLQRASTRYEALERLHAEGAGLYAGVRNVLQAVDRKELHGLPGTVATLIHVPPELDRAVATALGGQLQNVIADTWDDAQVAIEWLKARRSGWATFLPLDTLNPPTELTLPMLDGLVGLASELVAYESRYSPAVRLLLGRTAVVEDLAAARRLYQRLQGGFRIVTLEGEIVRSGGSVSGGHKRQARGTELLSRERERRRLPETIEALELEIRAHEGELAEKQVQKRELVQQLKSAEAKHRDVETAIQKAERHLDRTIGDLDQLNQELTWRRERLAEVKEERAHLQALQVRLQSELDEAADRLATAKSRLQDLEREMEALSDDETGRVLTERRTRVAVLKQEYDSQEVLVESRERELQRLQRQIDGQEHRIRSLEGELDVLKGQISTLAGRYEDAHTKAEAIAKQIPPLERELKEREEVLEALETQEQNLQRTLRESEQRLAKAEMEAGRREDQLQTLRREIEETLGIVVGNLPDDLNAQHPLPLDAIVSPLPEVTELPEGLERQIRDLRTQLRRLEPVNHAAKQEYEELSERYTFLTEQMEDLEQASRHLHQIIDELDEMMNTMFLTTFKSIASEFSKIFELLFNGGTAQLQLVREEDGDEIIGVEIMARPPGKRTSRLSMLSGGERSLTAVALLFGVMRVSPTPFCVLDEVDAMLDEANVGRFRRMLQQLSRETQFIIITHNRGTVEVADTIYGISMGDDGVSQSISLSLEDLPPSETI